MTKRSVLMPLAGLFLVTAGWAFAGAPKLGGDTPAQVTSKEVVAAATFAVTAQEEAMQEKDDPNPPKLKLVKILSAQQQVVAGKNFRLKLQVTLNGESREASAVVWWQAWREPGPYQLTSWEWEEDKKESKADAVDGE